MSSSLASTKATTLVHYSANNYKHSTLSNVSFRLSPNPNLRIFTKGLQSSRNSSTVVKAQLNNNKVMFFQLFSFEDLFSNFRSFLDLLLGSSVAKVTVDGTSNAAAAPSAKLDVPTTETNEAKESPPVLATEESVSEFVGQVTSLVKLVDSRDIVELELKQHDFEVVIRKKEALLQSPLSASVATISTHSPLVFAPPPSPAPGPASASVPLPSSSAASQSAKSSIPPLKSPMAGTFYRSPAPGEPPFVKIGDKVQKGQVVCIIEAMKLMNEIEADQSGTIVEIPMEDGKPVSIDSALFVIQP